MKIAIISENEYLFKKISLALKEFASTERVKKGGGSGYDLCICDIDTAELIPGEKTLTVGKEGADIPYPVSISNLVSTVKKAVSEDGAQLTLGDGCAYFRGRKIALTEVEYALLSALFNSRGSFINRESLISLVWKEPVSTSALNVYIHYLRHKLETGEKIIISSRGGGYKIDEKYL